MEDINMKTKESNQKIKLKKLLLLKKHMEYLVIPKPLSDFDGPEKPWVKK
jgi:hypothetical protein